MLILIIAESALETIPQSLWRHSSVKRHSKRRGKHPNYLLLDRSYHHIAMRILKEGEKRGRPDIIHFSLLEALDSPLNKEGLLQTYVHTIHDCVITVNSEARLPRNYLRFVGLVEQLFESGRIPPTGPALLKLERKTLQQLIRELRPNHVMAFSRKGKSRLLEEAIFRLSEREKPAVVVGGFPHGNFSETTIRLAKEVISIDPEMLDAWTVTSRIIYEYERATSLSSKRLMR